MFLPCTQQLTRFVSCQAFVKSYGRSMRASVPQQTNKLLRAQLLPRGFIQPCSTPFPLVKVRHYSQRDVGLFSTLPFRGLERFDIACAATLQHKSYASKYADSQINHALGKLQAMIVLIGILLLLFKKASKSNVKKINATINDLGSYQISLTDLDRYLHLAKQQDLGYNNTKRIFKEESREKHTLTATYDKKVIVHIKRKKIENGGFLGEGSAKKVYEALLYDGQSIIKMADLTIFGSIVQASHENQIVEILQKNGAQHVVEAGIYPTIYKSRSQNHNGFKRLSILMPVYGQTLLECKGDLKHREKIAILRDVAKGISECHGNYIVHYDLRSRNIFIDTAENGKKIAKVADFGIAQQLPSEWFNQAYSWDIMDLGLLILELFFQSPNSAVDVNTQKEIEDLKRLNELKNTCELAVKNKSLTAAQLVNEFECLLK